MSSNTFDRRIEITSKEELEKLEKILADRTSAKPITQEPYSKEHRARAEQVLITKIKKST